MGIFLLRIATQKKIRIIIWVIIVCTVIGTGYFFLQFLLQCWPVSYFWTSILDRNSGGKCLKSTIIINSAYAYSAVTCAVDLALCVVPILMVSKLQLNKRTKLSVMGVLSLWFLYTSPFPRPSSVS